ncbi:oligosaccharide flippase family protein [Anaerocolumna jejuensis]|uniref:oligosaccharide flippase family protein n=1 Tax=Anaerocolumna jejuensis TaxID=259063 RepID=UPI003F7C7A50
MQWEQCEIKDISHPDLRQCRICKQTRHALGASMNEINEAESARQIKAGAVLGYITIFINLLAGLIYTPWMIRSLGQDNYGLYTLSVSIIGILVMDFGLGAAVTRFLSLYNSRNDREAANNLLGIIYKFFFLLDIVIAIVLLAVYFSIGSIYRELSFVQIHKLKVIFLITGIYSILAFPFGTLNGILTSYEKFVQLKACELFYKLLNMALIIGALKLGYGLYTMVMANAVTGILNILMKLIFVRKSTNVRANYHYKEKKITKEIFSFSLWSTVVNIAQRFIYNIIPSILGIYCGAVSISVFGASATVEGIVFTFASAINGLFFPKVSRILTKENKEERLLELMIKVGRIQLFIIGIIFTGFLAVGRDFIGFWLGNGFQNAYICILFLIFPSIFELTQHIAGLTVTASGMVRLQSYVYAVMAVINVALSILLTREYKEVGAAVSVCTAYLFRTTAMNFIYYRKLKINVFRFFKECFFKMGIPLIVSLAAAVLIALIPYKGIPFFLIKGGVIAGIYLLLMWLFGLNAFEKELFLSLFQKSIKFFRRSLEKLF